VNDETDTNDEPVIEPVADTEVEETPGVEVDPIAVVRIGDDNGWSHYVMRQLGLAEGPYDEAAADLVKEIQDLEGFEPDGVVAGATWALILPMATKDELDPIAKSICWSLGGDDFEKFDSETWGHLIDLKLDELGI